MLLRFCGIGIWRVWCRSESCASLVTCRECVYTDLVYSNLKKPRAPEQILLAQFAEVYDNWVHDKFLALRNRQILVEKNVDPDRLQLTRYLHAIWEILLRAVQAYAVYREVLTEIRETYFHAISGTTDGTLELCSKELMVVI